MINDNGFFIKTSVALGEFHMLFYTLTYLSPKKDKYKKIAQALIAIEEQSQIKKSAPTLKETLNSLSTACKNYLNANTSEENFKKIIESTTDFVIQTMKALEQSIENKIDNIDKE